MTESQKIIGKLWHKIKGLDFYLKALLIAIPITGILLAYLLSIGATGLVFSDWFITLISVPTFIANQLSTSAYFGRITDLFTHFKRTIKENKNELIGTLIGIGTGIAIGIGLAVMHVAVPLASSLYTFATVLFTCRFINIFAGLGNRVGRCADKGSRPLSEKVIVATAGITGLTLGILLFATCTAAMISVVGVTSFFSGGAAIPIWIAGIIFILSVSSGLASSADYVSKGISFIRSHFIPEGMVTKTVKDRKYEYGGSLVGITLGLVIGAIVVGAIVIANPPLLIGIVGAVAGILIIITCVGIIGSIASRIGRLIDGFKKKHENDIPSSNAELHPLLNHSSNNRAQKRNQAEKAFLHQTQHDVSKYKSAHDQPLRHFSDDSTIETVKTQKRKEISLTPLKRTKSESNIISTHKNSMFYKPKPLLNQKKHKEQPVFNQVASM